MSGSQHLDDQPGSLYQRWITDLWNGPDSAEELTSVADELVTGDFVGHWTGP